MRTIGIEEELLLVSPDGCSTRQVGDTICAAHEDDSWLTRELKRDQLEIRTDPTASISEALEQLHTRRRIVDVYAQEHDARIVSLGTTPLRTKPKTVPVERYEKITAEYGVIGRNQLSCGAHVHVDVESDAEAVGVIDRIRAWLPPLLALSANSPFWNGSVTGFASFRSQLFSMLPTTGYQELFGTPEAYHTHVENLVNTGVVHGKAMIYFPVRLSNNFPTVEVRVMDGSLDARTTVLLAALVRALVETAAREWRAGTPADPVSAEVLRVASWRASKYGLSGDLLHPREHRPRSAEVVVAALVDHVRLALAEAGDDDFVDTELERLWTTRGGAGLQREVHHRAGELVDVVREAIPLALS